MIQEGQVVSKTSFSHPAGVYFVHIENAKGELIRKVISF
jgi:NADH:ubiquinone oxidoreductase subunit D